jgi:CheY-like chemotaxis protein
MQTVNAPTNVILAEDDLDDVMMFTLAVKKLSIRVELRHAVDGDELFNLLKQLVPDIVFLDIEMPCRDGISCIVEIRKSREYDHMPIVMYSSHRSKRYLDECYLNGANFYMVKPDSLQDLVNKLEKIFSIEWRNVNYFPPRAQFEI